ncbi:SDR family NAD(P)-dependent oxidoreductase [Pseudofrankia inefficax]|uniref:Short-chain dehydrogenase/reductase SDR n=1 Tax=Pseudofrankia inefficax (strain DSM 45817 / CECT 9037 / DDB 130130 / EuI1c) TaxID=298654 RepID=E3J6L2_PSEI1|nr:SDR family NAD(P)-dependent oxidoreductase [Pseudofrankia inefficax]ADP80788.1 short-chain dehydrogenase/reductase SDR [Pseudofrankia inefficax]
MTRVALVTGGASGLGSAVCGHLARAGRRVAVLDRDGAAAKDVAERLRAEGAQAMSTEADVSDRAAVDAALDRVRAELGPVDILVTSAGISGFVAFEEISLELWERYLAVNLTGTFHCIQSVVPDMVAAGWGRIVTISSAAGQTGTARQGHYSAAKAGVIGLTKAVALEYAGRGITANTIPPFAVDTPLMRGAQSDRNIPRTETISRMIPAGRIGTPDDIGATAAFLCSEAAGYVTGQIIAANGGAVL